MPMSFCGAFFCTCCRPALCVSVISAFSAPVTGPSHFQSAFGCSKPPQRSPSEKQQPLSSTTPMRLGCVLDVMARCFFSNASPVYSSASGLRPIYSPRPHETHCNTSRISNPRPRNKDKCVCRIHTCWPRPESLSSSAASSALSRLSQKHSAL